MNWPISAHWLMTQPVESPMAGFRVQLLLCQPHTLFSHQKCKWSKKRLRAHLYFKMLRNIFRNTNSYDLRSEMQSFPTSCCQSLTWIGFQVATGGGSTDNEGQDWVQIPVQIPCWFNFSNERKTNRQSASPLSCTFINDVRLLWVLNQVRLKWPITTRD